MEPITEKTKVAWEHLPTLTEIFEKFSRRLEPDEIEWKVQSYTKSDNTLLVPYIDARAAYTRLDEAFGPTGYSTEFSRIGDGFKCRISLQITVRDEIRGDYYGAYASREEVADPTDIEPTKGGASGALKRACHAFGLGRELYDYPTVMVNEKIRYLSKGLLKSLHAITEAINSGKNPPDVIILTKDGGKTK